MKKIAISLGIIGVVAAIVIGATTAYFSDTETSAGNLFKAGTIDIHVTGDNFTWEAGAVLEDMKPSYTDYINFTIYNDKSDPNPVNVWKKLIYDGGKSETGAISEPECTEQGGTFGGYDGNGQGICTWSNDDRNDIETIIDYDLSVVVYDGEDKIWWQTIYDKDVTVDDVMEMEDGVYLGMIPAGGKMEVTQSYHMQDKEKTNWAQGDVLAFSVEIYAEQLRGTAWLENKTGDPDWKIIADDYKGTLTYKVKNPTFDFTFTGKAPLGTTEYVLAAGMKSTGTGYDVDTYLGEGTSASDGTISFSGNINLNKDMKDVKVWLMPKTIWNNGNINWTGWPSMVPNILWETGLIWYDDTDL